MTKFEVDYSQDSAVVVHAAGCTHKPARGRTRSALRAEALSEAIAEARYQGHEESDRWDLGHTKAAPCARALG